MQAGVCVTCRSPPQVCPAWSRFPVFLRIYVHWPAKLTLICSLKATLIIEQKRERGSRYLMIFRDADNCLLVRLPLRLAPGSITPVSSAGLCQIRTDLCLSFYIFPFRACPWFDSDTHAEHFHEASFCFVGEPLFLVLSLKRFPVSDTLAPFLYLLVFFLDQFHYPFLRLDLCQLLSKRFNSLLLNAHFLIHHSPEIVRYSPSTR